MKSNMEIIKKVDKQGRLVLPKDWIGKYVEQKVVLKVEKDRITIEPYRLVKLTEFFDSIEADIKSDLANWKSVRRELIEVR
jgi:bifunctional DNA-binding transcriptional regulator/antitoxin component of YhaV-PrlF toxin-antitoxin module